MFPDINKKASYFQNLNKQIIDIDKQKDVV